MLSTFEPRLCVVTEAAASFILSHDFISQLSWPRVAGNVIWSWYTFPDGWLQTKNHHDFALPNPSYMITCYDNSKTQNLFIYFF